MNSKYAKVKDEFDDLWDDDFTQPGHVSRLHLPQWCEGYAPNPAKQPWQRRLNNPAPAAISSPPKDVPLFPPEVDSSSFNAPANAAKRSTAVPAYQPIAIAADGVAPPYVPTPKAILAQQLQEGNESTATTLTESFLKLQATFAQAIAKKSHAESQGAEAQQPLPGPSVIASNEGSLTTRPPVIAPTAKCTTFFWHQPRVHSAYTMVDLEHQQHGYHVRVPDQAITKYRRYCKKFTNVQVDLRWDSEYQLRRATFYDTYPVTELQDPRRLSLGRRQPEDNLCAPEAKRRQHL